MDLDDPTAVALLAAEALGRAGIEHALYGGLVLAAYGAARETRDARLLTPEDFVVFKVLSARELDLEDARSVLASLGREIDRALIESELATLARELPDHAVAARRDRVFA